MFQIRSELYARTLVIIKKLFDQSKFTDGKCEWLKLFPDQFNFTRAGSQLNLYGNEEDLFVSRLFPVLGTTYRSICNSPQCPVQVKQNQSRGIILSAVSVPPPRFLQESLTQWMETDKKTSTCGLGMNVVPPGAKHYLGSCIVQDPITGHMGQAIQAYCAGMRSNSGRVSTLGSLPPYLIMSLDIFARQGILSTPSHLPAKLDLQSESYSLFGVTFWNGGHNRAAVNINQTWCIYDGLWERQSRRKSLECCAGLPSTPHGYVLSHCVYIQDQLL